MWKCAQCQWINENKRAICTHCNRLKNDKSEIRNIAMVVRRENIEQKTNNDYYYSQSKRNRNVQTFNDGMPWG